MKYEFKVGDKVRIRQWDDMVKECGLDSNGVIKTDARFQPYMKHLCGRTATLSSVEGIYIRLKDWSDTSGDIEWCYCTDMIEPAETLKPLIMIYPNRNNPNETIAVRKNGNTVVDTAKAIYNPIYEKDGDTYSFEKGAEIAVKRLLGIEIKDKPVVTESSYREVTREAKTDEYVKIVNAKKVPFTDGKADYKNGDILKIIRGGIQPRYSRGCGDNSFERVLNQGEYVVLEGYQPTLDWDEFKKNKIAVHCDTEDKANAFLKECDEQGLTWGCGTKASSETHYFSARQSYHYNNRLFIDDIEYCENHGMKVVNYQSKASQNPDISSFSNEELVTELTRRLSK